MLSRQVLANHLPEYIRFFSPGMILSGLSTTELLDNLSQALLPFSSLDPTPILGTEDEEDKAVYVRKFAKNAI